MEHYGGGVFALCTVEERNRPKQAAALRGAELRVYQRTAYREYGLRQYGKEENNAHYGYDLFNSNFTSLKLINIHKHQAYFYFEEFETILSITDQGTLEVAIPLFDYDHIKRSFDDLKPKLIKLMEYYHNFDRENFILELLNSNFISKDLYDKINHLTIKKNKKIIQRISESKKRYIKKNLQ